MDSGAAPAAWVLNLDAELELAHGAGYTASRAVIAAIGPHAERVAAALLAEGDVIVDGASTERLEGYVGRAFCPTPRALDVLRRAAVTPEAHPSFDVLRAVNSRAFCMRLGSTLSGARYVSNVDEARRVLATCPEVSDRWRLKRAFGMTGRGQRVVPFGTLGEADERFVVASIERDGGLAIEPNVSIAEEYALHGWLDEAGTLSLGALTLQRCDVHGQWIESVRAENVSSDHADAIAEETRRVGDALFEAGYFGPFGVDAFAWIAPDGSTRLQPRSEINARYSMGFAVGFGRPPSVRR